MKNFLLPVLLPLAALAIPPPTYQPALQLQAQEQGITCTALKVDTKETGTTPLQPEKPTENFRTPIHYTLRRDVMDTVWFECTNEKVYFSGQELIQVIGWSKNNGKVLVEVSFEMKDVTGVGLTSGKSYRAKEDYSVILQGYFQDRRFIKDFHFHFAVAKPGSNELIMLESDRNFLLQADGGMALALSPYKHACQ